MMPEKVYLIRGVTAPVRPRNNAWKKIDKLASDNFTI